MDYLNHEPKFYSEEFHLVTLVFFLRIRDRDAVPVFFFYKIFLYMYVFFCIVSVDLGPLNLAWDSFEVALEYEI
jgi:hypothetical protein